MQFEGALCSYCKWYLNQRRKIFRDCLFLCLNKLNKLCFHDWIDKLTLLDNTVSFISSTLFIPYFLLRTACLFTDGKKASLYYYPINVVNIKIPRLISFPKPHSTTLMSSVHVDDFLKYLLVLNECKLVFKDIICNISALKWLKTKRFKPTKSGILLKVLVHYIWSPVAQHKEGAAYCQCNHGAPGECCYFMLLVATGALDLDGVRASCLAC